MLHIYVYYTYIHIKHKEIHHYSRPSEPPLKVASALTTRLYRQEKNLPLGDERNLARRFLKTLIKVEIAIFEDCSIEKKHQMFSF